MSDTHMPTFPPRNILVPVDFSPSSEAALRYALSLASRFEARVLVVHVWENPVYMGPAVIVGAGPVGGMITEYREAEAERALTGFLSHVKTEGVQLTTKTTHGVVHEKIVALIPAGNIDLVVMGTHGRHGVARFLIGSVAESVLREAGCPVLTVRAETTGTRVA